MLHRCLEWLDDGADALIEALEPALAEQRERLEQGSVFLGTVGNNAPFVGLLGTVIGVIESFHQLGSAGQNHEAMGNVMSGISEALVATAVGLLVALPAVVGYNLAQKKVSEIEANVSIITKQMLALLKSDHKAAQELRSLGEAPVKAAASDHGSLFTAVVQQGHRCGVQFHALRLPRNFVTRRPVGRQANWSPTTLP